MSESISRRLGGMQIRKLASDLRFLFNAILTDLKVLRTPSAAIVTDYTAGRAEIVKLVTDYTAGRAQIVNAIADVTAVRAEVVKLVADVAASQYRINNTAWASPDIADGTTAGKLKTQNTVGFAIAGVLYSKAATDDLWDLSAKVDTDGTHYRAYWLYLDSSGTATVAAGTDALTSVALALAALPAKDAAKSVMGIYVAGPSTDFNNAGGLAAQGTIYNGMPTSFTATAVAPAGITASGPAAVTASNPAAVTAVTPAALATTA